MSVSFQLSTSIHVLWFWEISIMFEEYVFFSGWTQIDATALYIVLTHLKLSSKLGIPYKSTYQKQKHWMTVAILSHSVPSPLTTMGKPAKWAWVRSTLSPRLTVKITVPSPPASSTVRQNRLQRAVAQRGGKAIKSNMGEYPQDKCLVSVFSPAREKVVFFFLEKGYWKTEYWKWERKPSNRELRHFVSPGDQCRS